MRVAEHPRTTAAANRLVPSPHPVKIGPPISIGGVTIRVVADPGIKVTLAQARLIAQRAAAAWQWDKAQLGDTPQTAHPFAVQITRALGNGAGETPSGELIQVNQAVLKSPDDNVFAHELSHLWDARHTGARWGSVPEYLAEGRASLLGDRFDLDHSETDTWLSGERKTLANDALITPAFVRRVFADNGGADITYNGELVGELFVEFLRTRLRSPNGTGTPGTVPKLAELTRRVGAGEAYPAVFADLFGTRVGDAQAQFLAYLAHTRGNPQARFAGTVFAGES